MRIVRLHLQNYRRHVDTQIEFPDGVTAIVGRNGSGKSSILEAIAFGLYGTPATRTNKALLRHEAAAPGDAVRVEIEAEVAGQALRVVRELRGVHQTGVASLTVDGQTIVPPQAGSSEAVTEEVARRIGLDREAFFNTVCAQQKELGRLAQKSKAERKRLVLDMLGIDALDRAIQEAGVRRRTAEERLRTLQERLPDAQEARAVHAEARASLEAAQADAAAATANWQQAQAALARAQEALQAAQEAAAQRQRLEAEVATAQQEQRHLSQRVDDLSRQLAASEAAASQAAALEEPAARLMAAQEALEAAIAAEHARRKDEEARAHVERLRKELEATEVPAAPNGALESSQRRLVEAQASLEGSQAQVTVLVTEARSVRDRLRRVGTLDATAACPVCQRPLDGHAEELHATLEADLEAKESARAQAEARLEEARTRLSAAQADLHAAQEAARRHEEGRRLRGRLEQELQRAQATLVPAPPPAMDVEQARRAVREAQQASQERTRLLALASQLADLVRAHDEAAKALAAATHRAQAAQERLAALAPAQLDDAQQAHAQAAATERQAERGQHAALHQQEQAAARLETCRQRLEEARKAEADLQVARQGHREWQVLAGTRGTGLLDRFRSHLVSRIGPAVAAEASRLLTRFTGGRYSEVQLDEDYEVYVTEHGVAYQLERFSGGECDLVHLALRLAVSRLLLERSGGTEIRFLALDEVFGSLDDERRDLVLGALQELGSLYSQVLLVTHHEDLRDALDHTLLVEEVDGAATVRMHNG